MTEPIAKRRLEDEIRPDEAADDLVLLLRGGEVGDNVERSKQQAARLNRRYTLKCSECHGVSAFAATTPENKSWVLATKMRPCRRYYRIGSSDLAGFRLLHTFKPPHWTVRGRLPRPGVLRRPSPCGFAGTAVRSGSSLPTSR